jgi:AraC family transcriptional regulator
MPEICVEPVVLLNPPGTHHRDCFDSLDDARFLTVSLDAALWNQATRVHAAADRKQRGCPALALPAAYRLWRQLVDFDDTSMLAIEAEVQELLARSAGALESSARASDPAWLARARARLEDDVGNVPGIAELAREAGLHPVYFARAFRRAFGCSPGDYLRQRRIDLAIAGLCGGVRPLAEVAGDCGFADQSHMSHALQRAVGLSPLQLRRLSRLQVANLQERRRRGAHAAVFAQRELPA